PVSNIRGSSATLRGQLISLGDWPTVYVWFEWGPTTSYGNKTSPKVMNSPGPFESEIAGLQAGGTYHYRAVASGAGSGTTPIVGSDIAFSTVPEPPKPALSVTTGPVTSLTTNSAILSCVIPSLGDLKSVQVYFEWGISSAYGNATPPQTITQAGTFTASLTGLNPGTTYHYRAVVIGPAGPVRGSNATFTTQQEPTFGLFSCARR
ncbi:MAG: fibronectin type III domain-containing protein, partial [Dehalococcoidia bacterium]|nr:fibronectin type III domain-containing protein [Dehalococcoidia bacterium]